MSERPPAPPPQDEEQQEAAPERHERVVESDDEDDDEGTETTHLLANNGDHTNEGADSPAASSLRSLRDWGSKTSGRWRWPSIVALTLLLIIVITILGLGFAAPAVLEEYAKEAIVFEPTGLSIHSFTSTGVQARVQGDFKLDGSRVHKSSVRDLGRAMSWIARKVESEESIVQVYLPEYHDMLLGTATIPPIVVTIREGTKSHVDVITDLSAGDLDGLKSLANDWIRGKIARLVIRGEAMVPLKSGMFYLGTQSLSNSMIFGRKHPTFKPHAFADSFIESDLPAIPQYDISRLNFHEVEHVGLGQVMEADVSVLIANRYPVKFTIPSLGFNVEVPGCSPEQPRINVADARTSDIFVKPKQDIPVQVHGLIRRLPDTLTSICPKLLKSPLDMLLGDYMNGDEMTVYISGSEEPTEDTPDWVANFLNDIVVPVGFHGKTFDNLIRNFSMADVHFGLPNPFSGPDSPDSKPRVSATIKALIGLPDEMNFSVNVSQVKANADIFFHDRKLGNLDLKEWQKAESKRIDKTGDQKAGLKVSSVVKDAPINITDNEVFADLVQKVVFGGKKVTLAVKAAVDVETTTVLGKLVVRDIPAEGEVFVHR